ncbi:MAG: RagB/SusD family nutrient uptake outer membrane protein [Tannerella sp.]|jgi:hypothetical protein|nr:RagB/SusD family nutrient uptake outer membrane protein [Tannerella sp.]
MKKIFFIASSVAVMLAMSSCSDYFLDLKPTDAQTEVNYYRNAAEFQAAANGTYSFYGFKAVSETVNGTSYSSGLGELWDNNSDVITGETDVAKGTLAAGATDAYWGLCYAKIRKCNVLLEKAAAYTGTDDISASVATAKFFRAYQYFFLLRRFGGVPIITSSLSISSEELHMPRNSRYEVIAQVLEDLDEAINSLPDESAYDGHVSKQGAQAFKARVLLFEATWEKYVSNTTDGDGTREGAGSAKPAGYPSIEAMLTEAASLANTVMNSGKYELWEAEGTKYERIAYSYLFNLEDANTNPMGFTKDRNKEYILQIAHDHTSNQTRTNITKGFGGDQDNLGAVTLKWMNMAPCTTDGLPYLYSVDYRGYNNMTDLYANRDDRLTSCIKKPGQKYYSMYWDRGADASTYALADYVGDDDQFPDACITYYPIMTMPGQSGFQNRKMISERKGRTDYEESYNYPVLRLAEVYLIYAEAKCELGNGTISNEDLNISVNKLHARAGSAPISNASVEQARANYAANTGQSLSLTILDLIRNERAVELRCEDTRQWDLKRWGIAEQELNASRLGIVLKNPDGTDTEVMTSTTDEGEPTYSAGVAVYGLEALPDGSQALVVNPVSNFNMTRKNYLYPLPNNERQLNPALLQNPGY